MTYRISSFSETGRRSNNEDAVLHWAAPSGAGRPPMALLAVADGVGGQACGGEASHLAVNLLHEHWLAFVDRPEPPDPAALRTFARTTLAAIQAAFQAHIEQQPGCSNMASTIAAAFVVGQQALVAHLGDSRAYVIRAHSAEGLEQITRDHSAYEDALQQGLSKADADTNPFRHALTRCLDAESPVEPEVYPETGWLELGSGAVLCLCTDGLYGSLSDAELYESLTASADLDAVCRHLADRALQQGSRDNISLVVLGLGPIPRPVPHTGLMIDPAAAKRAARRRAVLIGLLLGALGIALIGVLAALWLQAEGSAASTLP